MSLLEQGIKSRESVEHRYNNGKSQQAMERVRREKYEGRHSEQARSVVSPGWAMGGPIKGTPHPFHCVVLSL